MDTDITPKPSRKRVSEVVGRVLMVAAFLGLGVVTYVLALRPRQLRWGATDEEVVRSLPGDEIVEHPTFDATRAVTVEARPEDIWPWLVQIGFHRAGWYSYDWIDNFGRKSAESILPELQHLAVGDGIPMGPHQSTTLWVKDFAPKRWILWGNKQGSATWLWVLDPVDDGRTRLITRVRSRYSWTSPTILFSLPMDIGDIVMMRKSMLGIKRRAETMAEHLT